MYRLRVWNNTPGENMTDYENQKRDLAWKQATLVCFFLLITILITA